MPAIRLRLRPARPEDAELLWLWANDADVRASSLSPQTIPWSAHLVWYRAKLTSGSTLIFIAENAADNAPLGQVRFDLEDRETAAIDISVAATSRNSSVGIGLLEQALAEAEGRGFCRQVIARVKEDNTPSRRLFEKARFACIGSEPIQGSRLVIYQRVLQSTTQSPAA